MVSSESVIDKLKHNKLYSCDYDLKIRIQNKTALKENTLNGVHKYFQLNKQINYMALIDRLRIRYEGSIPVLTVTEKENSVSADSENDKKHPLRFDDNEGDNRNNLDLILNNVKRLREEYTIALNGVENNSVYFKTIDNFILKIERLMGKELSSPNKISKELEKALTSTLMKNYAVSELQPVLDDFFIRCNFVKVEIPVGKKIDDDDLDYIDEHCRRIEVSDSKKHNTIIDKRHDAFIFDCYDSDEEELFHKIIPGEYSIGCWKE